MGENREAEYLRSLLIRLEWAGVHSWNYEESGCPACHADEDRGRHEPDCWLNAAIRPTEG